MSRSVDVTALFRDAGNKAADEVARLASTSASVRKQLVAALEAPEKRVKNAAAKALARLSELEPATVRPWLPRCVELAQGSDSILKWNAMIALGHLAAVDSKERIDAEVVAMLADAIAGQSLIAASHAVAALGKIARAKPALREQALVALVAADSWPRPSVDCQAILAGKTILALEPLVELVGPRPSLIAFGTRHLSSPRAATNKKAQELLARLDREP